MPIRATNSPGIALHHLLYAVLATGLVVLVVMQLGGRGDAPGGEDVAPAPAARTPPDPTLMDPAPYRSTIEQIELILYRTGPAELADADRVSRLALQLGTQLLRAPNRLQGQRAGREVTTFSNRIGQQADVGYATPDLPRARADWEQVRGRVFRDAPWFRSSPR